MNDSIHQQLLGHLLGVLDDDEHQLLDARLEREPDLCRELTAWRRRLSPLEALRPDHEPRPGLARRTCRLVAAYASSAPRFRLVDLRMSPQPTPPSRAANVGWFDMAVVVVFLFVAVALVVPAIQNSRVEAGLAACQNGLRQFGIALTQYSNQQRSGLAQLANNERLTRAGLVAASRIKDAYSPDDRGAVCPDGWLATQATLCETQQVGSPLEDRSDFHAGEEGAAAFVALGNRSVDWPGAWRNGTTDGLRSSVSRVDSPLLADAPSADAPGQNLASHGGRGRNVWYSDGRTDFQPRLEARRTIDRFPSGGEVFPGSANSAPIIFVGGR